MPVIHQPGHIRHENDPLHTLGRQHGATLLSTAIQAQQDNHIALTCQVSEPELLPKLVDLANSPSIRPDSYYYLTRSIVLIQALSSIL